MATDEILGFLQFGDDPSSFDALPPSALSPFLPSFAALSTVSPSLAPRLLAPFVSHPLCPTALSYAALDFSSISGDVLRMEAEDERRSRKASGKAEAGAAAAALEVCVEEDYLHNDEIMDNFALLSGEGPPSSYSAKASRIDESLQFERADEEKRVKIAILSLRRRASEFSKSMKVGMILEKLWFQLQENAGSIWNYSVYYPELCCLLPIAVSLCPAILLPEHLIWGLLSTNRGFLLLSAVLLNNPILINDSFSLLSDFLLSYHDAYIVPEPDNVTVDMKSGSSRRCSVTPGDIQFRINSLRHMQSHQLDKMYVNHCVNQALLTMLYLSTLSNSLAHLCREWLIKHCIFAGVILYLTTEHLHDELDFMSKVIFSDKRTSEWMLSYLGSGQMDSYLEEMLRTIELTDPINSFGMKILERKTEATNAMSYILKGGRHHLRQALLSNARSIKEKYGWCGQLHGHLRLYCVLIRAAELHPTHQEIDFWLKSFGSIACEETLYLAISFFCLVPGLSTSTSRSLYQKSVSTILNWELNSEAKSSSTVEELTLWFAVQLFLRQFSEIAAAVREVLGMHLTIQNALIQELHDAAIATEILAEPSLLLQAVAALRPKGPISTRMKSTYLLKCLEQLLLSGHFARNGIDVSEALSHCISISTSPVHPLLIQVIQMYVDAPSIIIQSKTEARTFKMPILPRTFLEGSFVTSPFVISDRNDTRKLVVSSNTVVREALVSYYVLYREKCLQNVGVEGFTEASLYSFFNPEKCKEHWWTDILLRIPIKQLMSHMENNWLDFEHLFPKWLSLAAGLFPEMFHVRDLLDDVMVSNCVSKHFSSIDGMHLLSPTYEREGNTSAGEDQNIQSSTLSKVLEVNPTLSIPLLERAIANALKDPLPSLQILNTLCLKSNSCEDGTYAEYNLLIAQSLVPKLLDRQCMRCLQDKFCLWFKSLQPLSKQTIFPTFIQAILDTSQMKEENENLVMLVQVKDLILEVGCNFGSYADLVQQPLILLGCKLQVYRTPLLRLILEILSDLLIINRRVCVAVTSDVASREQTLKSEEVSSALMAQDSAVCQILLEACLPNKVLEDDVNVASLLETRKTICEFLSGFLEQNNSLLKLIHFQGYDKRLIPMMVDGIPAMTRCFSFLPELLQQQQQSKQVFAVILIAKISCAYVDLPESYSAIEKAITHVKQSKNNICSSSNFMHGVLGVMAQVACAFPSARADIIDILQSCMKSSGPLKHGGYPRDPVLHRTALSAFKYIVKKKFLYGRLSPSVTTVE